VIQRVCKPYARGSFDVYGSALRRDDDTLVLPSPSPFAVVCIWDENLNIRL